MTVLQNVMEGPVSVKGMPKSEAAGLARGLLAEVGLSDKVDVFPNRTISGGREAARGNRAGTGHGTRGDAVRQGHLGARPRTVGEVLGVMRDLAAEGMTMIIVTHEIGFAREVADRVVFMRDGIIVEEGPARDVIGAPRREATRAFLSHFTNRG